MKSRKAELGELEREVMRIVWTQAAVSAETVREKLDRGLKEATVRTVLRRLEAKGYLTHQTDNRTFLYTATESRSHAVARAVKRIVDWFDGSIDEVLVGMVDAEMLDPAQLERLSQRIEQARQSKKPAARAKKGTKS